MPFCPKCEYEYRDEVVDCPDCGVALVGKLDGKSSDKQKADISEDQEWVHVARLKSEGYALMLQEGLREQDIPIVVMSNSGMLGQTGQMGFGLFNQGSSGYQVYIPEKWVEKASVAAEALIGEEWTKSLLNPPVKPQQD